MGHVGGVRFCDACGRTMAQGQPLVASAGREVCPSCEAAAEAPPRAAATGHRAIWIAGIAGWAATAILLALVASMAAHRPDSSSRDLRARSLVLVNDHGIPVALLTADGPGCGRMVLADNLGRAMIDASVVPNGGGASLDMVNGDGSRGIALVTFGDSHAGLFVDKSVFLGTNVLGDGPSGVLRLWDATGAGREITSATHIP